QTVNQLIKVLPQEEKNNIQQLLPNIIDNVQSQIVNRKPSSLSTLRKNKIFKIQNDLATNLNSTQYQNECFC
mgnify:CR=1